MYSNLFTIVANAIILKYVLENERNNCECAMTWHHNFIKLYAPVVIFLSFVSLLFKNEIQKAVRSQVLIRIIFGSIGLISFAYITTLLIYFFKLERESNCDCSRDWKRNALLYPIVIFAVLIIVFILLTKMAIEINKA